MNGHFVDTEVCRLAKCPFLDKKLNICGKAYIQRKSKREACVSTVSIRVESKLKQERRQRKD